MSLTGSRDERDQHDDQPVMPGEDFAKWAVSLSDEQRSRVTPAERAERLLESARRQRQYELALADRCGWR